MANEIKQRLKDVDATVLIGTTWNPAGLILAKSVPRKRAKALTTDGVGAAYAWHAFTIDKGGIALSEHLSAVGDQRMVGDTSAFRPLGEEYRAQGWVPLDFRTQSGGEVAECSRTTLRRVTERLGAAGVTALVGHEVEFVLTSADGSELPAGSWAPYSLAGLSEFQDFVDSVYRQADFAGLKIEQFHAEYGIHQLELSLAPASPVAAADHLVLIRAIVSRAAREWDFQASFSPRPFTTFAGNGAHQHFSLHDENGPLFSGGSGPHGLTPAGAQAIAGVQELLPQIQGVLAGSVLSGSRLAPGMWAGAYGAWGVENREAALRLITATPANPRGAHMEVKIVDPSANGYAASAAILGAALYGIQQTVELGPEAQVDPSELTETQRADLGISVLPTDTAAVLNALDASAPVREMLGDRLVDAIVAVRRYEVEHYGNLDHDALAEKFRLAWTS